MTQDEYDVTVKALQLCEKACLDCHEERLTMRCFREADGAMGCFEAVRKILIELKYKFENGML